MNADFKNLPNSRMIFQKQKQADGSRFIAFIAAAQEIQTMITGQLDQVMMTIQPDWSDELKTRDGKAWIRY